MVLSCTFVFHSLTTYSSLPSGDRRELTLELFTSVPSSIEHHEGLSALLLSKDTDSKEKIDRKDTLLDY